MGYTNVSTLLTLGYTVHNHVLEDSLKAKINLDESKLFRLNHFSEPFNEPYLMKSPIQDD